MKKLILFLAIILYGNYGLAINEDKFSELNLKESDKSLNVVQIEPTFNQLGPYCIYSSPVLPLTSNNGATGTWSPSYINGNVLGTTVCTFTPDDLVNFSVKVVSIQIMYPTFYTVPSQLSCGQTYTFDSSSSGGVLGTWSQPVTDANTSQYYYFYPEATTFQSYVYVKHVGPEPIFENFPSVICYGDTSVTLPMPINMTGYWSPSVIDPYEPSTYYFYPSPTSNGCQSNAISKSIGFLGEIPDFSSKCFYNNIAFYMSTTSAVPTLPTISDNGIAGTWSPSVISPTTNAVYIFTPNSPSCAVGFKMYGMPSINNNPYCFNYVAFENPETYSNHTYIGASLNAMSNYSVSGSQNIKMESYATIELFPNSVFESSTYFEAYINEMACVQNKFNDNQEDNNSIKEDNIDSKIIFSLTPNPSNGLVEVLIKNSNFNKIIITSIDGKTMLDKEIESTESYSIDVSNYSNGMYIVNVIANDGQQYSKKLIKN